MSVPPVVPAPLLSAADGTALAANLDLAAFFVVGLLGGAHCLGMCGPLVTTYAERFPDRGRGPSAGAVRQHALFNAGRTLSYTLLGAGMGAVGAVLVDAGALLAAGRLVRGGAGLVAGTVIVVVGVGYVVDGRSRLSGASVPLLGGAFARVAGALQHRVDRWAAGPGIVGLGAIHGLLPCPLLYPAFLYALAAGSPVQGGLALAALGLGTFPALFVYGTALESLSARVRRRLHRALGVAFVVAGTVPLAKGLGALGYQVPHVPLPMPPLG